MKTIFEEIFFRPLFNLLVIVYNNLPYQDLGIAVIVLVLLLRLLLWPLFSSLARSQITFAKLQPEVQRIQKKFKNDKVAQTQELLALYRKEKFNPFSGFFAILIQLPIIIALYQVFLRGVGTTDFSLLYPGIQSPGTLNHSFLGLVDLTKPFLLFTILAGIAQFFQGLMVAPKTGGSMAGRGEKDFTRNFSRQMVWFGPIITFLFLRILPSVIALYWFLTSAFSIVQQLVVEKNLKKLEEKKNA